MTADIPMCAVLATAVSDAKAVKIILNVSGVVTIVKSVAFALLSNNPHCLASCSTVGKSLL